MDGNIKARKTLTSKTTAKKIEKKEERKNNRTEGFPRTGIFSPCTGRGVWSKTGNSSNHLRRRRRRRPKGSKNKNPVPSRTRNFKKMVGSNWNSGDPRSELVPKSLAWAQAWKGGMDMPEPWKRGMAKLKPWKRGVARLEPWGLSHGGRGGRE